MLMNDKAVKEAVEAGELVITPFSEGKLQGASYDLAIGGEALVSNNDSKTVLSPRNSLHLQAGDFALVLTKEKVKFPLDMAGNIGMRSWLARKGLMLLAGMQVDPGFEGHLRFGLYNASPRAITLDDGDALCMLEFHRLSGAVEHPPARIPELLEGTLPEVDRDFLRSLETTSLSDLSQNVRSLTQSVTFLTKLMTWFLLPLIIAIFAGLLVLVAATAWRGTT